MIKLKNNARGFLASAIGAADTQLILSSGTGASFPTLTAQESFFATIVSAEGAYEIVNVTSRSGDVLTIERGAEGTTAQVFNPGSLVELRVTVGNLTGATTDPFREFRPGDAPNYFELSGGATAVGLNGSVYRFTGLGTAAIERTPYPLTRLGSRTRLRMGYQRV